MFRGLLLAGFMTLVVADSSSAQSAPPPPTKASDFVMVASQTDEYERQAGALAGQKGKEAKVRDFGKLMVTDHTKTSQDLMAAAMKDGLTPPPGPPMLRPDQTQMLSALRNATSNFDRTYIGQQVKVHQNALKVMQTYASKGDKPALKAAAAKTEGIVRHHLMLAEQIKKGMK
jgi:putative membrane protein